MSGNNHDRWRLYALCTALVLYGLFSSPTPDNPGIFEALIGVCLLIAIGKQQLLNWCSGAVLWQPHSWREWIAFYLILVPTIIGLLSGVTLADIIRDVIPLGYLFLPLLIINLPNNGDKLLAISLFICGAAMGLRYWLITDSWPLDWHHLKAGDDYLYLPLEPAVMFTAIAGPVWVLRALNLNRPHPEESGISQSPGKIRIIDQSLKHPSPPAFSASQDERGIKIHKRKYRWLFPFAIYGSLLAFGAMSGMLMRAALGLSLLSIGAYTLYQFRKRLGILVIFGIIIILVSYLFAPDLFVKLWEKLATKTENVGLNTRDDEFAMVLSALDQSPLTLLFGQGWGSTVTSPAVANTAVRYTHSMISYFGAKTGIIGLAFILIYLFNMIKSLGRILKIQPEIVIAALPTIILGFTLYTSYKYLTFGITLLLVVQLNYAYFVPQSGCAPTTGGNRPPAG